MNDEGWREEGDPPTAGLPGEPMIDADVAPMPAARTVAPAGSRVALGVSLVLIALNLRPVFSSVSALLPEIMASTGLSPGAASLLTTLPVLCLGVFAPLAPLLAARFGAERTLTGLMVVLAVGTAVRGVGTVPALLAGAVLAGAAIAVGNVLLPGLVKRDFPERLALMTGLFTMALSGGAAAAAGLTVPLRDVLGGSWAAALAAWAVPAVVALVVWLATSWSMAAGPDAFAGSAVQLWRRGLAWQITLFMGTQSAMAYCVFGYLAPILRERGLSAGTAGAIVSWSVAVQCIACLLAPVLALRGRDQRIVNVAFFVLGVAGYALCVFGPLRFVLVSATLQGFGQGGLIALAMTAIVLRSADARVAAALSAMAQSVGYALASIGPLLLGFIRGTTGSYDGSVALVASFGLVGAVCAFGAGRPKVLEAPGRPPA